MGEKYKKYSPTVDTNKLPQSNKTHFSFTVLNFTILCALKCLFGKIFDVILRQPVGF